MTTTPDGFDADERAAFAAYHGRVADDVVALLGPDTVRGNPAAAARLFGMNTVHGPGYLIAAADDVSLPSPDDSED